MANIAVSHTAARGSIPRIGIIFFFLLSLFFFVFLINSSISSLLHSLFNFLCSLCSSLSLTYFSFMVNHHSIQLTRMLF